MLKKRESLATQLVGALSDRIAKGDFKPGDQIPTEHELCGEYGVSRTVVREAIASLRSDGLLVSRQGVGVFVSSDGQAPPFRIDPSAAEKVVEVIQILELRLSVEVEAAGLAAERRTKKQLDEIAKCLKEMEQEFHHPEGDRGHADYQFHTAISRATNNSYFEQFMEFLGPVVIPRLRLDKGLGGGRAIKRYHERIQAEHAQILEAIKGQNPSSARGAMRKHLANSLARYRRLADEIAG